MTAGRLPPASPAQHPERQPQQHRGEQREHGELDQLEDPHHADRLVVGVRADGGPRGTHAAVLVDQPGARRGHRHGLEVVAHESAAEFQRAPGKDRSAVPADDSSLCGQIVIAHRHGDKGAHGRVEHKRCRHGGHDVPRQQADEHAEREAEERVTGLHERVELEGSPRLPRAADAVADPEQRTQHRGQPAEQQSLAAQPLHGRHVLAPRHEVRAFLELAGDQRSAPENADHSAERDLHDESVEAGHQQPAHPAVRGSHQGVRGAHREDGDADDGPPVLTPGQPDECAHAARSRCATTSSSSVTYRAVHGSAICVPPERTRYDDCDLPCFASTTRPSTGDFVAFGPV